MTELEKKANIADKKLGYEEARLVMKAACERADASEMKARIDRDHAKKMADRVNQWLKELNEAMK